MTKFLQTKISGVTYENRQNILEYLSQQKGLYFYLERDYLNKYDSMAVKVFVKTFDGRVYHLGFIPKEYSPIIGKAMDENKTCFIKSYAHTGGGYKNRGVLLQIIYGE